MARLSTAVTLVMLALFAAMVGVAMTYPAGARMMPLVIGIPAVGLCLVQLALDLRGPRPPGRAALPRLGKPADLTDDAEPGSLSWVAERRIWLYFLGFIGGVLLFGFLLAVPVLVTLYLWRDADVRLRHALIAASLFTLTLFLMFEEVLTFRLHEGFVTPHLLDAVSDLTG